MQSIISFSRQRGSTNLILHLTFMSIIPLLLGWLLDLIFGDPERLPHPIVWMGRWIAMGERILNRGVHRMVKGAVFTVMSIVMVYALVRLILTFVNVWFYLVLATLFVFYCLAGHTLRKEVRMVFEAVDRSVEDGRKQVARIVGRDTSELTAHECRTAALETLAENLSDGVIAPLFWLAMLGVPGMVAYKMVNTFDSMIGYRNERYKDFGCWAARIDDVANYVPARLTAFLLLLAYKIMCMVGMVKGKSAGWKELLGFVAFFGSKHASPNSGWPEAALAGILDCRFGGGHIYFGQYFYKPFIGTNERKLTTSDMRLSVRISLVAEVMMVVILLLSLLVPSLFHLHSL